MQPLQQAVMPRLSLTEARRRFARTPGLKDLDDDMLMAQLDLLLGEEVYLNDRYQVNVRRYPANESGQPALVHLSIKRIDRQPIHDWRDLQWIKNQVCGAECEGVELYPAESRLVDTANQYHIWVIDDPAFRWPFGFGERTVHGPIEDDPASVGQRPFEQHQGTLDSRARKSM